MLKWLLCVTTIFQISTLLTNNRERQSAGIKRAVSAIKAPGPNGPIDVSLVETPLNSYILFYICVLVQFSDRSTPSVLCS